MCVWRREGGGWGYFFEEDLDLGFGVLFFFCGFGGDVGGGCEAGVGVEESICLVLWSISDYMGFATGWVGRYLCF